MTKLLPFNIQQYREILNRQPVRRENAVRVVMGCSSYQEFTRYYKQTPQLFLGMFKKNCSYLKRKSYSEIYRSGEFGIMSSLDYVGMLSFVLPLFQKEINIFVGLRNQYEVYYLEGGQEYYFRHSWYDSYNFETGEFCLRKINDYFAVSCDAYTFAQKGDTFNGYINTEATVTFDSFTCNWYSFKYGLIKVDHNPNSICTCISDDYFNDEDYQNRIEQVPIYCEVEIVYGGKTYTYSFYDFYITPYANNLDTAVWAEPSYEADEYVSNLDGSGYYFTVSAGTLDRHCTITYEWYKSDDLGETFQLIPGKTGYQISLNDLGDPVIEDSDDEAVWWQYKDRPVKCVVKFDNGNEVAYRTVNFLAFYGIDNLFDGNTIMTAKYGDVITVPVNGSFIEPLKSKGFTYEYQWCYEIQDENGWDEYQLGTSKTVTIDTSMLPVYHNSEGDYSEFYCRSYPYYNGRPYSGHGNLYCRFFVFYTDRTTPDTSGVAINATNFPDSNFRKYVSDYIDQNKSGYLNDYEIE